MPRQRIVVSLCTTLILLGLPAAPVSSAPNEIKVLLIGDSITNGVTSGSETGPAYPAVLQTALGQRFDVIAEGCNGATSSDWHPDADQADSGCGFAPHYAEFARPHLPTRFAVILLGTNDAHGFLELEPTDPLVYGRAILELATTLREDGAETVIVMSPPRLCEGSPPEAVTLLNEYVEFNDAICTLTGTSLCGPPLETLLDPQLDFADCDVHPNVQGHQAIGQALAAVILAEQRRLWRCGLGGEAAAFLIAWWSLRRRR